MPSASKDTMLMGSKKEDLACKLTQEELLDRGQQLARVNSEIDQHETHSKQVKDDLKATESRLDAERAKWAGVVRARAEYRPVEVDMIADFKEGVVREIRTDTGEEVRARALTDAERQGKLKLHEDGKKPARPGVPSDAVTQLARKLYAENVSSDMTEDLAAAAKQVGVEYDELVEAIQELEAAFERR
jgi:hypothetical protein